MIVCLLTSQEEVAGWHSECRYENPSFLVNK